MAILRATLFALVVGACYSPDLADCTVTCSSDADCASGQRCTDQLCSREAVSCSVAPGAAAAVVGDTPPEPDAPTQGVLRVKIADQGLVRVPGQAACDSDVANECMYVIELGVPILLEAEPHDNRVFERWEENCLGVRALACEVTPTAFETRVTAKFHKID